MTDFEPITPEEEESIRRAVFGGDDVITPYTVHETTLARRFLATLDAARSQHLDEERLAEAWANVMDGRRVGEGLHAERIGRDTTTSEDWAAIVAEYRRLSERENRSDG